MIYKTTTGAPTPAASSANGRCKFPFTANSWAGEDTDCQNIYSCIVRGRHITKSLFLAFLRQLIKVQGHAVHLKKKKKFPLFPFDRPALGPMHMSILKYVNLRFIFGEELAEKSRVKKFSFWCVFTHVDVHAYRHILTQKPQSWMHLRLCTYTDVTLGAPDVSVQPLHLNWQNWDCLDSMQGTPVHPHAFKHPQQGSTVLNAPCVWGLRHICVL